MLAGVRVDAAHDDLAISPGGRFVYLATGTRAGRIVDLATGLSHPLTAVIGTPGFSSDGATVVWVQRGPTGPRLAGAPSGGGPSVVTPLPVPAGDKISDLAVSPDGSRLAYTVTRPDGRAQLRLAALPDGLTLAVSDAGAGQSPNWSPSAQRLTVLAPGPAGPRIQLVNAPTGTQAAYEAVVRAFANAQISADRPAQQALAATGAALPTPPRFTRAALLWLQRTDERTATARIRLTVDATTSRPVVRQAEETVVLRLGQGGQPPRVSRVTLGRFVRAPAGPAVSRLDTRAAPAVIRLSLDSDLAPATVPHAVRLTTDGGRKLAATITYDAADRTVTIRPTTPAPASGTPLIIHVSTALRDVAGNALDRALQIPVLPRFR